MTYECTICNACSFELKENYDRHRFLCIFKHKSKKEKQKMIERIPIKLTETDTYQLVLQLVYKCETLEKRLAATEEQLAKINRKQRISILSWLNSSFGYRPPTTFKDWIKGLPIHSMHIEMALKTDLVQGMVLCLKDAIFHSKIIDLPFCAFHQKQKNLYIFQEMYYESAENKDDEKPEDTKKWIVISNEELLKIVNLLSQLFLRHYLQCNELFLSKSVSENDRKENELTYLKKITGNDVGEVVKCRKIMETLINMVQRDFNEIEIV
jgi:hypothetical protein